VSQDANAEGGMFEGYGGARTKVDLIKRGAVLAKGEFAVRSAIKIVEDGTGETALRKSPQICNVDNLTG
jgi:hypothetical protein